MAAWIKAALGMEAGLSLGDFALDPVPPPQKRGKAPKFLASVYCGQTAGWIKMALGMEVGLGPDGDPGPLPKKGAEPPIFGPFYCGQTAAWIKMLLSTEVGLRLCDNVLDGDPAPPPLMD